MARLQDVKKRFLFLLERLLCCSSCPRRKKGGKFIHVVTMRSLREEGTRSEGQRVGTVKQAANAG